MKQTVTLAKYQALEAQNNELKKQHNELKAKYEALKFELERLKKLIFNHKQERFVSAENAEQLTLDFGQSEEPDTKPAPAESETITYQRRKKQHPGRHPLPDNIPTEDIIIEPDEDVSNLEFIGEQVTETIDYKPGVLFKRRYIRRKYARKSDDVDTSKPEIVIGSLPNRPIPKGIAEAGLLAYLFVCKFIDHLPFYRQIEIFKRQYGWEIHKTTINDWFAACCSLLEPLYEAHLKQVMDTDYLQADESPIKVQDCDKKGKTHQGYMWVYRNPINGLVLFDYRKGRGTNGPKERLQSYTGYLQCDGYKVYQTLAKASTSLKLVSCMAHIRRKFYDAQDNHPELATYALGVIQKLYALECKYRKEQLNANQILERRQVEAKPVFDKFVEWVHTQQAKNLSKEPIGKALFYAKNQLPLLRNYLKDGRILLDNNLIENAIRPLALGRKNYLFAGSHPSAQRIAMMYSFFASCKTNDINPIEWLTDVLKKIPTHPINKIEQLLPKQWTSNNVENNNT